MISSDASVEPGALLDEARAVPHAWRRRQALRLENWTVRLVCADAIAVALAAGVVLVARFGPGSGVLPGGTTYAALAAALVPAWLLMLTLAGTYDSHYMAAGAEQYRRILNGGVWLLAILAFGSFALRADVSRTFVLVSVPLATLFTIAERFALRKALQRRFARDRPAHRVLAIGSPAEVTDLATHMRHASYAGFRVVAALTPGQTDASKLPVDVEWAGAELREMVDQATQLGADTIAVAGTHMLERGGLRKLSWALEGTDIQLVVIPGLTDLAGPRVRMRPVDGLPLLHIEKPQFTGARRVVKETMDRVLAAVLIVAFAPVMVLVAIAVRCTSRGSVMFRQRRVGLNGQHFALLKFRTMAFDADHEQSNLEHLNEHQGVLFKIRRDPRLTPVGRFLRRFSLDELPQLVNVLFGDMSLVGPRPPLPSEVERYDSDVHRRLLVKPGLTGMWQVSGRSDLSWEETVRLDLYYVDHWSVGLDLVLLGKTFMTVLRGRGAY